MNNYKFENFKKEGFKVGEKSICYYKTRVFK